MKDGKMHGEKRRRQLQERKMHTMKSVKTVLKIIRGGIKAWRIKQFQKQ